MSSEIAKGCAHFQEYKKAHGLQSYRIIYKYLVKPSPEAQKLKVTMAIPYIYIYPRKDVEFHTMIEKSCVCVCVCA